MLFETLVNRDIGPTLERVMSFTQARHEVLTNNISNFDTVGYKTRDLSESEFVQELDKALGKREQKGSGAALEMKSGRTLHWDRMGRLQADTIEREGNNILFQDQNNRSVEKEMSLLARNGLLHNMSAELLRQHYGLLDLAIRGKL